ncbi:hypothetical protein HYPSUDRAFT_55224 [Hypholoma sublateritium FD-334 SS-4]|uniref:Uncharacterized protein n=1 Tax=Hypholoma sublateritium (strain FD-334 SS-4) TaxID=945553 RepID=A0A0D2NZK0_HYPSF|nr:hypothetical protein HYPSUDRAFT_55224 [Hypholoma sublateritium FD-334 SS-4]
MPVCFCTVRGCRDSRGVDRASGRPIGRIITANVLRVHSLDELAQETNNELNSNVEDDEIDQLSAKIAGTTLADQMNGPSTAAPGGRLWGHYFTDVELPLPASPLSSHTGFKQPSEVNPSLSQRQATTSRSREAELSSCLSSLEKDINTFVDEVELDVGRIHRPSSKGPPQPFPLETLIKSSESLQDRLDTISFKSPIVKQRKECIALKLSTAVELLKATRHSWDTRLVKIEKVKTPSKGVPFDTAHHYIPILSGADPILQVSFFMIITCQIILGGCSRALVLKKKWIKPGQRILKIKETMSTRNYWTYLMAKFFATSADLMVGILVSEEMKGDMSSHCVATTSTHWGINKRAKAIRLA